MEKKSASVNRQLQNNDWRLMFHISQPSEWLSEEISALKTINAGTELCKF
jgi:hypothetical protein